MGEGAEEQSSEGVLLSELGKGEFGGELLDPFAQFGRLMNSINKCGRE